MIINDLNYLEVTNEEVIGGGVYVDKDVDIDIDVDYDANYDVDLDVDKDINATLDSDVNIDGNFASVEFDATGIGDNSFTEATISVLATDDLSEVSGVIIAAVD